MSAHSRGYAYGVSNQNEGPYMECAALVSLGKTESATGLKQYSGLAARDGNQSALATMAGGTHVEGQ